MIWDITYIGVIGVSEMLTKKLYLEHLAEVGAVKKVLCNTEEAKFFQETPLDELPNDVFYDFEGQEKLPKWTTRTYWRYSEPLLSNEEIQMMISIKNLWNIRIVAQSILTIKKIAVGLAVLVVAGIVIQYLL